MTVSHDKIETLLEIGRQHGAVAGKLTGGGRGGSMLILTKEEVTAKTIVAAAEKAGAQHTWIEKLEDKSLKKVVKHALIRILL